MPASIPRRRRRRKLLIILARAENDGGIKLLFRAQLVYDIDDNSWSIEQADVVDAIDALYLQYDSKDGEAFDACAVELSEVSSQDLATALAVISSALTAANL